MSGCKFYNTIQYKPLIYNWLFFHCKNKKLLWTFKRYFWRRIKLNIKDIEL